MTARIEITSDFHPASDLMQHLSERPLKDCTLNLEAAGGQLRSAETTVLVAVVGLAGTGLGALITGLLNLAATKRSAFIEIKGADWSVRVPAETPKDELREIIAIARTKPLMQIQLSGHQQ